MRMSLEEYKRQQLRNSSSEKPKNARGRVARRQAGTMNKTEARFFEEWVKPRLITGELVDWWFEEWKFKLAPATYYEPDFILQYADGLLVAYEVKGARQVKQADGSKISKPLYEDDAIVKVKIFPTRFPMMIYLAYFDKEFGWQIIKK